MTRALKFHKGSFFCEEGTVTLIIDLLIGDPPIFPKGYRVSRSGDTTFSEEGG
jgi:hypothetical protein